MNSYSRQCAHSLEYEPQIDAEGSKMAPNRGRTQQNGTKSMQNVAKWHQIDAERSKLTENHCRTQQIDPESLQNAHFLENKLIL